MKKIQVIQRAFVLAVMLLLVGCGQRQAGTDTGSMEKQGIPAMKSADQPEGQQPAQGQSVQADTADSDISSIDADMQDIEQTSTAQSDLDSLDSDLADVSSQV